MADQQQSRWRPTRGQVLWAGSIVALAFLMIVVCGYLLGWKWTGLPERTLWDWLKLLIVPAVLAVGGYLFTRSENQRTRQSAEGQRALDREIATQQTETDREIADQRRQDDTLQAYLDQIGQLLLDEKRPLRESKEGDEVRTLARARILTVLARLDGDRKGTVLRFLHEARLITGDSPIINLYEADLRDVNLHEVRNLEGINLGGANLIGAILRWTNLKRANLTMAFLSGAELLGTNLEEAKSLRQ